MNAEELAAHMAEDIDWNDSDISGPGSEDEDDGLEFEYDALDDAQVSFCSIKLRLLLCFDER